MKRKAVIVTAVVVIVAAVAINIARLSSPYSSSYPTTNYTRQNSGGGGGGGYGGGGGGGGYGGYGKIDYSQISFSDDAESNSDAQVPLKELTLLSEDLDSVTLAEVQGDRNLLLVVLRGAPLCPFCTAQTSRLVSNYTKFTELGAEVAVVFPGTKKDLQQLLKNARLEEQTLPFPVLVDTELDAIRRLEIEADKAKPSTYIIDQRGRTRFAYIGASMSDRPSIQVLVSALERIQPSTTSDEDSISDDASTDSPSES